jgi:hypothetical protein
MSNSLGVKSRLCRNIGKTSRRNWNINDAENRSGGTSFGLKYNSPYGNQYRYTGNESAEKLIDYGILEIY